MKALNNKLVVLAVVTLAFGLLLLPGLAYAEIDAACADDTECDAGEICGVDETCVADPSTSGSDAKDPFGINYGAKTGLGSRDIRDTIGSIINVALGLLGIVAVVIVLAGGFKWMTSGGNEEKSTEARKLIFAGIIGLAIILSAYAISRFVLTQLYTATSTSGTATYGV